MHGKYSAHNQIKSIIPMNLVSICSFKKQDYCKKTHEKQTNMCCNVSFKQTVVLLTFKASPLNPTRYFLETRIYAQYLGIANKLNQAKFHKLSFS